MKSTSCLGPSLFDLDNRLAPQNVALILRGLMFVREGGVWIEMGDDCCISTRRDH